MFPGRTADWLLYPRCRIVFPRLSRSIVLLLSSRLCFRDRDVVGSRRLCRPRPQPTTAGADGGRTEREPGEQDFTDGGEDFAGLEQMQPQRCQRRRKQMSRGQRGRRARESGAGESPELRGQPRLSGQPSQTSPEHEGGGGGGETAVLREETLLPFCWLREDVRQVVPP